MENKEQTQQQPKKLGLLKKAVNEQAFLKAGLLGFPGSGKTFTASMMAIGIAHRIGGKKPVAFFDTETGSDFLVPRFEAEGIELLRVKSHSFADLLTAGKEAEEACSCLIVDSISHVWRELCESYRKRRNITRLSFQHWGDIKGEWARWTSFYLNSKIHIFVLGRAGYEYDFEKDEDGKNELIKVGTKMKVESEFGFEPSLLIEMERVSKGAEPGSGWQHRAHILKDRTDTVNGKMFTFEKPHEKYKKGDWSQTFKPFKPVFDALNIGGEHVGVDTARSSEDIFDKNGEGEGARRARQVAIALEEIEASLTVLWPGQSAENKQAKAAAVDSLFGVRSWTAVQSKPLDELLRAVKALRRLEDVAKLGQLADVSEAIAALKKWAQPEAQNLQQ